MGKTYLTVREAARIAGVDPETVRSWYRKGALTKYVVGIRSVRIDEDELRRLLTPRVDPPQKIS